MRKTISGSSCWRGKVEYKSLIPPAASLKHFSPNFLGANLTIRCTLLLNIFLLVICLHLKLIRAFLSLLIFGVWLGTERHCHGSPRCSWRMG